METYGQLQRQRSAYIQFIYLFWFENRRYIHYRDKYRSMPTSLATLKKVALHENVRTLQLMEAGLRAHTKDGTLSKGHSLAELKSILDWRMTLSCAEIFASLSQMAEERRPCTTSLLIQPLDHTICGWRIMLLHSSMPCRRNNPPE
jgi:hypothetical protein